MEEMLKTLFQQKLPLTEIAARLNTSQASISRYCKKYGLKRSPIWTIVDDEQLINNKELSTYELAIKYNISPQAIHERLVKLGINKTLQSRTIEIAEKNRKHHLNLEYFYNLNDVGSYWLGFLYADGSVHGENNHRVSLGLASRDRQHIVQLCDDIDLPASIIYDYIDKNGHAASRMSISNMHLSKLLWKYGMIPGNTYKTKVPSGVEPNHFIRGFLDGDGSIINKKGRLSKRTHKIGKPFTELRLNVENLQLANSIKNCVMSSGVILNGPYESKNIFVLTASHKKALCLASWIWNNPTRTLHRKYEKYLQLF